MCLREEIGFLDSSSQTPSFTIEGHPAFNNGAIKLSY